MGFIILYYLKVVSNSTRDTSEGLQPCAQEEADSGIFLHVIDAAQEGSRHQRIMIRTINRRVANQFFLVNPRDHFFCPVPSFSEMKIIG